MNGEVVFVPDTAPGDLVKIEIIEKAKNYSIGRVVERLEDSPERTDPPCPVFRLCGGCDWQHISYAEQLRQKQKILESSFRGLSKTHGSLPIKPFRPSPVSYRYRNRIQLHRRGSVIGYFRRGTHDLVPIEDCLLAESEIAEALPALLANPQPDWGKKFEIARTESGPVKVLTSQTDPEAIGFSQVNSAQNRMLIESVIGHSQVPVAHILDLYCGHGNFTFPLARRFPEATVTGVELSKFNIQVATEKKASQGLSNVNFIASDVSKYLTAQKSLPPQSMIVLDPPRTGVPRDDIRRIVALKPDILLYVSCQPMTLTRDLQLLLADNELKLEWIEGFDMFPQTAHLEILTVVRRQGVN